MHEAELVEELVGGILTKAIDEGAAAVRSVTFFLSPDSQMDEMMLRIYLGPLIEGTLLERAEIVVKPMPPHMHCPACNTDCEHHHGEFKCPVCGGPTRPANFATGLHVGPVEMEKTS